MKNILTGSFLMFLFYAIILAFLFSRFLNKNTKPENTKEVKVDSLHVVDIKAEKGYILRYDSLMKENEALHIKNIVIVKSINKLILQNEENKRRVFNSNDSVLLVISDSILRANGL